MCNLLLYVYGRGGISIEPRGPKMKTAVCHATVPEESTEELSASNKSCRQLYQEFHITARFKSFHLSSGYEYLQLAIAQRVKTH